jgi:DltD protein
VRRLAIGAAALVVVLVLSELGARALGPYLPEPPLWTDDTTTVKVAQLDALDCADLVFAGNSMARDGLDPVAFEAADPEERRTYNAALDAATPALQERWVLDEVDPRVTPDGVVLGVSSFDLNDSAAIGRTALGAYDAAPLSRDDLLGRLQAPFIRSSALVRYRNEIRDPEILWDGLGAWRDGERQPRLGGEGLGGLLGPEGQGLSRRELTYEPSPLTERFAQNELLNDFHLGGDQTEAAEDLLTGLADRDVDTAIVVLPVTDDYVDLHPGGAAQYEEFLALVERLASENGAEFIDLHDLAPDDSWFADTHHLNATGAEALSTALPELLPEDFAIGDRCP